MTKHRQQSTKVKVKNRSNMESELFFPVITLKRRVQYEHDRSHPHDPGGEVGAGLGDEDPLGRLSTALSALSVPRCLTHAQFAAVDSGKSPPQLHPPLIHSVLIPRNCGCWLGTDVYRFFADTSQSLCRQCRCLTGDRVVAALWGEMNSGNLKTHNRFGLRGTYLLKATVLLPVSKAERNPAECFLVART